MTDADLPSGENLEMQTEPQPRQTNYGNGRPNMYNRESYTIPPGPTRDMYNIPAQGQGRESFTAPSMPGRFPTMRTGGDMGPVSPVEENFGSMPPSARKYFGHPAKAESTVTATPISPVVDSKKNRFSFMRRNSRANPAVAAH